MAQYRLALKRIERSLRAVQREFTRINQELEAVRDPMVDEIVANMLAGYAYVDRLVEQQVDLMAPHNCHHVLELNHIVLCGLDPAVRKEHSGHMLTTQRRFYEQPAYNIDAVLEWYQAHQDESAWKRAAGVYIRILSQPQLFIEGNHRTGALIMSAILAREAKAPFVLTVDNAKAYFDPSTLIKATRKTPVTLLVKLPRMKKRFAKFLQAQANRRYLRNIDDAAELSSSPEDACAEA